MSHARVAQALWRLCHQYDPDDPARQLKSFVTSAAAARLRTKAERDVALSLALRTGLLSKEQAEVAPAAIS